MGVDQQTDNQTQPKASPFSTGERFKVYRISLAWNWILQHLKSQQKDTNQPMYVKTMYVLQYCTLSIFIVIATLSAVLF